PDEQPVKRCRANDKSETYERRLKELDLILRSGFLSIKELEVALGELRPSHRNSIRKDIRHLMRKFPYVFQYDAQHVFALLPPGLLGEHYSRLRRNVREKKAAAAKGCDLITNEDAPVFIGSGGTGAFLACEIARRSLVNVHVVTGATFLLLILRNRVRSLTFVGGKLHAQGRLMALPYSAWSRSEEMNYGKCFLGVEGLSKQRGVSCHALDAATQDAAWRHARELVVFMTDHTEIGAEGETRFATFDEIEQNKIDYRVICGAVRGAPTEARVIEEQKEFGADRFMIVWADETRNVISPE
ncbi:MAG: DeoR/GlpR transcriptional regulator, partial [Deltaproteobacteria bacterium]|nr:DeoR/GlpR transcriptional regulator [Deltaproteobacteria bacterium]